MCVRIFLIDISNIPRCIHSTHNKIECIHSFSILFVICDAYTKYRMRMRIVCALRTHFNQISQAHSDGLPLLGGEKGDDFVKSFFFFDFDSDVAFSEFIISKYRC